MHGGLHETADQALVRLKAASILYDEVKVEGLGLVQPPGGDAFGVSPWSQAEDARIAGLPWVVSLPYDFTFTANYRAFRALELVHQVVPSSALTPPFGEFVFQELLLSAVKAVELGSNLSIADEQGPLMGILRRAGLSKVVGGDGPLVFLEPTRLAQLDWDAIATERLGSKGESLRSHLSELYDLAILEAVTPSASREVATAKLVKELSSPKSYPRALAESGLKNAVGFGLGLIPVIGPVVSAALGVGGDMTSAAREEHSWAGVLSRHLGGHA